MQKNLKEYECCNSIWTVIHKAIELIYLQRVGVQVSFQFGIHKQGTRRNENALIVTSTCVNIVPVMTRFQVRSNI